VNLLDRPRLSACYVLAASVRRNGDGLVVAAVNGTVTVEDDQPALDRLAAVLKGLDGTAMLGDLLDSLGVPSQHIEELWGPLVRVCAVHEVGHAGACFYRMSSNPQAVRATPLVDRPNAAARRTAAGGERTPLPPYVGSPFGTTARRRRSLPLGATRQVDARASLRHAISLAADSYHIDGAGRRPLASAGALYPLQFWAVGGPGDELDVVAIDHDHGMATRAAAVSRARWQSAFLADDGVRGAISSGAATIVVCAELTRMCDKYGDRGWRYGFLEAGAAAHHIGLLGADRSVGVRSVGGYVDAEVAALLAGGTLPLLTILVAARPRATG
jgi:hypothetical protein